MGKEFKNYVGGKVSYFDCFEDGMMSLIELSNMTEELGLTSHMNFHYFIPRVGWKLLETDGDVV